MSRSDLVSQVPIGSYAVIFGIGADRPLKVDDAGYVADLLRDLAQSPVMVTAMRPRTRLTVLPGDWRC